LSSAVRRDRTCGGRVSERLVGVAVEGYIVQSVNLRARGWAGRKRLVRVGLRTSRMP